MNINVEFSKVIPEVAIITPDIYRDKRGFFMEVFKSDIFEEYGLPTDFVQQNHSGSEHGVLRGLHFQYDPPMGKLMRVTVGCAFLVAVDIRKHSPTLGKYVSIISSGKDRKQLWAPAGFARGFYTISDYAEVQYQCTGLYNKEGESAICWNDPDIGIEWPLGHLIVSEKDSKAQSFKEYLDSPISERVF